jgi:hypothetical protein
MKLGDVTAERGIFFKLANVLKLQGFGWQCYVDRTISVFWFIEERQQTPPEKFKIANLNGKCRQRLLAGNFSPHFSLNSR